MLEAIFWLAMAASRSSGWIWAGGRTVTVDSLRGRYPYNRIMINVTEMAAGKIQELLTEENRLGAGLRVFVQGGGCSGFQYGLMIDEGQGDAAADQVFEVNGVRLLVDPISLRYLKGAEVDFVDNSMGGGFTIKNPNAKSTCGCGSSFNV